jgi:hypothetical protein
MISIDRGAGREEHREDRQPEDRGEGRAPEERAPERCIKCSKDSLGLFILFMIMIGICILILYFTFRLRWNK